MLLIVSFLFYYEALIYLFNFALSGSLPVFAFNVIGIMAAN